MAEHPHPIIQLLKKDPRYPLEAYQFVRESLAHAQKEFAMGPPTIQEGIQEEFESFEEFEDELESLEFSKSASQRHVKGQQLCEGIRQYALEQYGFMAKTVLNSWGIYSTSDFGEIVYNLINIGLMKKSADDRREDFNDVYDFEEAFRRQFQISVPD